MARELKDYQAESKVLWNLMLVAYYKEGNRDAAVSYGEQSLAIAHEYGLEEQLVFTLTDIAKVYFALGREEEASAALRECDGLLQ